MIDGSFSMRQQTQIKHGLVLMLHYGIGPSQVIPRFPDANTTFAIHIHLPNVNGHQKPEMQLLHLHSPPVTSVQFQQTNTEEYAGSGIILQDSVRYQAVHLSISVSTVLMTLPSTTSHTRQYNALIGNHCRAEDSTHMPSDKMPLVTYLLARHANGIKSQINCLINYQLYAI